MDLQLDRYKTLVKNAASLEYPPRIVIARLDVLDVNNDYFNEAGIEVESLHEFHLYDDRVETCYCSPFDRFHYSEILGWQLGNCKVVDLEAYKKACKVQDGDDYFDEETGEPRPYVLIEDALTSSVEECPDISVNNERRVFTIWDFQDGSSDDSGFYNGTHQHNLLNEAIEDDLTLAESLRQVIDLLWEQFHCNGSITECDCHFGDFWKEDSTPVE